MEIFLLQETRRRGGPDSARSDQVDKALVRLMLMMAFTKTSEATKTSETTGTHETTDSSEPSKSSYTSESSKSNKNCELKWPN